VAFVALTSLLSLPEQPADVTGESLSALILAEIVRTCGPQLPCYRSEEILNGFIGRFGLDDGMAICQRAFGKYGGMWRGAPVTVWRFQESNDGYFARPLLEEARR
jgi:hypothetical protein